MKGFVAVNDRTPDDEPLFLYVLCKAAAMDTATGSLDAESAKKDTSDRKKLQKILSLFVKYNADMNTMGARAFHRFPPLSTLLYTTLVLFAL